MSGPYDPNLIAGTQTVAGKEYALTFAEPAEADGTTAEGYPIINATTGAVSDIVITNKGSGYSSVPTVTISPGQNNGTATTLTAVRATSGEFQDKIISVSIGDDQDYRTTNSIAGTAVDGGTGYLSLIHI